MQKLIKGIHQFQNDVFDSKRHMFEGLVEGQHPTAMFITCSDSRVSPNLLTQTEPGEIFVLRNAGNIVPPYEVADTAEAAAIEYAVKALQVKDIIICGHSHCGAMSAMLAPEKLAQFPAVQSWLKYAEPTLHAVEEAAPSPTERMTATIEQNVLVQLQHMRTHPSVAEALENKTLNLHGWVYKFETGQVFTHDPQTEKFVPLMNVA